MYLLYLIINEITVYYLHSLLIQDWYLDVSDFHARSNREDYFEIPAIFENESVNHMDGLEVPILLEEGSLTVFDHCLQVPAMFHDIPEHIQDMQDIFEEMIRQVKTTLLILFIYFFYFFSWLWLQYIFNKSKNMYHNAAI